MQELVDSFGRVHDYLRISLTDKCNLRCSYCMPTENMNFMANKHLMTADEIVSIAETFVKLGIKKIRLTGGEPLVRADFDSIFLRLSQLPVSVHITTNGVLLDKHLDHLVANGLKDINISLDSLQEEKFETITKRHYFRKVMSNIKKALDSGLKVKVNNVLMKGFNENEILDFVALTSDKNLSVRFIEFMPFNGNKWDYNKTLLLKDVLAKVENVYNFEALDLGKNHISKNYKIKGFEGDFGVISTVSSHFCSGCNRVRLTADGKLKNCLFSTGEADLLSALRKGEDLVPLIATNVLAKKEARGGMVTKEMLINEGRTHLNRSMVAIGG